MGVLHLNPETSESTVMVAEGTLLAQLYPSLKKKEKYSQPISVQKMLLESKIGTPVRYTTINDAKNQIFLDSTITSIDATATKTEKGNFFKIEAETNLTSNRLKNFVMV